jgi:hypothetical protein
MPRRKETLTLSIEPGDAKKLCAIAWALNQKWGENPSPSHLISAIANEKLIVISPDDPNDPWVKAREKVKILEIELIEIQKTLIELTGAVNAAMGALHD